MLLDEHRSKELLAEAGVPVPQGILLGPDHAGVPDLPFGPPWFVKAQVLAGGRGKAGAIQRVDDPADLDKTVDRILAMRIKGLTVPRVRIESGADVEREFYLSLAVSRSRRAVLLTAGRQGGMEIETRGEDNLLVQEISPDTGPAPRQARAALFHLGLDKEQARAFDALLASLWRAFTEKSLLLAEINPLVLTRDGVLLALDGKVEVDDNGLDLNPDLARFLEPAHYGAEENAARQAGLSYVGLDGFVGLMVNGAGLAMATMDLLNHSGLPAANFLDLGGGADEARMRTAFGLLFANPAVRLIFINLYGGILSCEKVARAMRDALGGREPEKPMVARLAGNGAAQGLAILKDMGLASVHPASGMGQAMDMLCELRPADAPKSPFEPPLEPLASFRPPASVCAGRRPVFDLGRDSGILVQGLTGREGRLHAERMLGYGARVMAGVTPFKGGQEVLGLPVYDTVAQAVAEHDISVSVVFVPPALAADAVCEAAEAGVPWVACITEGIPQQDMLRALPRLRATKVRLVGPNTPGIMIPGRTKMGIAPAEPFTPGPLAVFSRSGTLTYEVAARLSEAGLGQSVCVGMGGDPFTGLGFVDLCELVRDHEETRAVVVLGEIGGQAEEELARYVCETNFPKPVISFVAGRTAPPGRRLGHAGAILESGGSMEDKLSAMRRAGFLVSASLTDLPGLAAGALEAVS